MKVRLYVKFGAKPHLELMQKEGLLFCNSISYFVGLEDGNNRGDNSESIVKRIQLGDAIIQLKEVDNSSSDWKQLKTLDNKIDWRYDKPLGNLFCLSALELHPTKQSSEYTFHYRFMEFGNSALIIHRSDLFIEKLNKALAKLDFRTCFDFVQYFDFNKHSGQKTLFQKDNKYSWQQEFRVLIYTDKFEMNDPFELRIGSLADISEIIDLSLHNKFHYRLPNVNETEISSTNYLLEI